MSKEGKQHILGEGVNVQRGQARVSQGETGQAKHQVRVRPSYAKLLAIFELLAASTQADRHASLLHVDDLKIMVSRTVCMIQMGDLWSAAW